MKWGRILRAGFFCTGSLLLLYKSLSFPRGPAKEVGPAFWPSIILAGIAILSFILIVKEVISNKEAQKGEQKESERKGRLYLVIFFTFVYLYLLNYAGFMVLTTVLLGTYMYLMGARKKWVIFGISILFVVCVVLIFGNIIKVPFPRGFGLLREMSYLFY